MFRTVLAESGRGPGLFFFATIAVPPRRSTCQQASGFSAGARSASPVRRLKQA
jgi:hypothetical protein